MALTGNKICGVCGAEISAIQALYTAPEMNDNCYMCSECRKKCSPFLEDKLIHAWKKYDAENHIAFLADSAACIESAFHETDSASFNGRKLLCVDAEKKWWYIPGTPDIFRFEQIKSWEIGISTETDSSTGLHLMKYTPPRPGMPVPGRLEELTGMRLYIELAEHPYAETAAIDILTEKRGLLKSYKAYLDEAYSAAEECFRLLEKYADSTVTGIIH